MQKSKTEQLDDYFRKALTFLFLVLSDFCEIRMNHVESDRASVIQLDLRRDNWSYLVIYTKFCGAKFYNPTKNNTKPKNTCKIPNKIVN